MTNYIATFKPVDFRSRPTWAYIRRQYLADSPLAAQVRAQHIARERVLHLVEVREAAEYGDAFCKAYC